MAPTKRLITMLCASLAFAGCSDNSLSPDTVNPLTLADDADNVTAVFSNGGFQSMAALSFHFPNYGSTAILEASLLGLRHPQLARNKTLLDASTLGLRDIQALFPADVLGKTLEWDTETDEYVVGDATGAPANGIRIVIYSVNPLTGMPVEEPALQELGYVELTDESTPQFEQLGILLRILGNTFADYSVRYTENTASIVLSATGRINSADLAEFVDFTMSFTIGIFSSSIAQEVHGSDGTVITLLVTGGDTGADIEFSIGRGGNTVTFDGTLSDEAVNANILFNGTVVATITGNPDDPTVTVAEGFELTQAQLAALGDIFQAARLFLDVLVNGVFGPAEIVF